MYLLGSVNKQPAVFAAMDKKGSCTFYTIHPSVVSSVIHTTEKSFVLFDCSHVCILPTQFNSELIT